MPEEKEIVSGEIGPETKYDVDFVDGKIIAKIDYKGEQVSAGSYVSISLIQALKVAALKTDNKIDDKIVKMIEALL